MQNEDLALKQYQRPENRIANQINSRATPGSNSGQNKLSHSPGHWKKYISNESNLNSPKRRLTNYNDSKHIQGRLDFGDHQQSNIQDHQLTKFEEQKRRKQDMMKRVEQIQKKVNPILKNQHNQAADQNFGWTNRMQQRILRLETNIDSIQKEMQIKIQKRLLEVERQWNAKIETFIQLHQEKLFARQNKNGRLYGTTHRNQEGQRYRNQQLKSNKKHSRPLGFQQSSQGHRSYQFEDQKNKQEKGNVEGFFTKRQNECSEAIDDHI